jgi:hypothetical protein
MALLPALAIAGTAISALGAVAGGISAGNEASYQAEVARQNQQIATQNQQRAAAATATQTEITGQKAAQQLGAVRAAFAANNIDVNSGSAADVQKGQRQTGYLEQENTSYAGAQQTYGYGVQASEQTAQAGLYGMEAAEAPIEAGIGAVGSVLSQAPQIPAKFDWMAQNGGGSLF